MKKILTLLLVLTLALTLPLLTACGKTTPLDGDDPVAAVKYMQEKTNALNSYKAEMTMTMTFMGTTETQTMTAWYEKDGNTVNSKTVSEGTEVITIGDTTYTKITMDGEETKFKGAADPDDSPVGDFFEDGMENVSFVSKDHGVYIFKADVSNDLLSDLLGDVLDEMGGNTVTDLTMEFSCNKDGLATNLTLEGTITVSVMGVSMDMEISMHITFSEHNAVAHITAPADAADYLEEEE